MKGGVVTSLSVYSEKGGRLRIVSPATGELIEKDTEPGEMVKL